MSRATVEFDFFPSSSSNKSQLRKSLRFRGISKTNPQILRSVLASTASVDNGVPISSGKPNEGRFLFPALPADGRENSQYLRETTPLTIFYNGSVSVFNVPRDTAERIVKIAVQGGSNYGVESKQQSTPLANQAQLFDSFNDDLPIARRKSLHRFLEKRKHRLTSVLSAPYGCSQN